MTLVDEILDRWPLRAMCSRLGIELPARDGVKFASPFRPDRTPSCDIYRETICDYSQAKYYDSIACFAEHHGLSNKEAIHRLAAELPGRSSQDYSHRPTPPAPTRPASAEKPRHPLVIPPLRYSTAEAHAVAAQRGLSPAGTEFAGAVLDILGFAEVGGFPCWVLRDGHRQIAEARRMDGQPFPAIGSLGERKSHTLRGSRKSWPIGLAPKPGLPPDLPIVLCEGGPDLLAACDVLFAATREFIPVTMLGAGGSIDPAALPLFAGRDVKILAHPDDAGINAATRWKRQLRAAGARPVIMQLRDGDLNDLVTRVGAQEVAETLGFREF